MCSNPSSKKARIETITLPYYGGFFMCYYSTIHLISEVVGIAGSNGTCSVEEQCGSSSTATRKNTY